MPRFTSGATRRFTPNLNNRPAYRTNSTRRPASNDDNDRDTLLSGLSRGKGRQPMHHVTATQPEHWILLAAFFTIFAVYGFLKKPRSARHCLPCLAAGILAIAANTALLMVANRVGYGSFNIVHQLTLQQASIESSFIVIGYCLMLRGLAILARAMLTPQNRLGTLRG
jgi:uncharacterized protein (DUF486 family)